MLNLKNTITFLVGNLANLPGRLLDLVTYRGITDHGAKVELASNLFFEDRHIKGIWYIYKQQTRTAFRIDWTRLMYYHIYEKHMENSEPFPVFEIVAFFSKGNIVRTFNQLQDHYEHQHDQSLEVYQYSHGWTHWRTIPKVDNVLSHNKEDIIQDIRWFLDSEDFYTKHLIPYRRGYLFYGPPGNGKTSMIRSVASIFGRDLYYLSLDTITGDTQLIEAFNGQDPNKQILIVEDVDSYFREKSRALPKSTNQRSSRQYNLTSSGTWIFHRRKNSP